MDKFFNNFFSFIDNTINKVSNWFNKVYNWFTAPRCKCKLKGKVKEEEVIEVDKTFENETKK